ncbi:MAG: hypothetical protein HZA46_19180 [Planctomycetales bacterium]|nr:hypothetical protein [Planctomycetales bacterium]
MKWLDNLDRRFGRYAIPNITLLIVMGQALTWVLSSSRPNVLQAFFLLTDDVRNGEVWRLVSFLFIPPGTGILTLFGIYLFYLMGSALEVSWGTLRYNVYLLIAYVATLAAAFLAPAGLGPVTNVFIGGSVFLAFSYLYPDFVLYLFFVLPVKIKWLALLTWIGYAVTLISGDWQNRALVLASIANFLLFFADSIFHRVRYGKRRMESAVMAIKNSRTAFHKCATCGVTEHDNSQMEFRFCSKCEGNHEYCSEHLRSHEHVAGGKM